MRPVFYLHIPKTGGQTLAARLASAFAPGRSRILEGDLVHPRDAEHLRALLAQRDLVEAHVDGPLLADVENADILCTVREPISRIISAYLHIRRAPNAAQHRAAHRLTATEFFRIHGQRWANQQTRGLVEAMVPGHRAAVLEDRTEDWLRAQLPAVLRRLRWLVPTEAMDAFILLWSHETGRHVPGGGFVTNVAAPDTVDLAALRRILQEMPELYALDLDLWVRARRWMAEYRRSLLLRGIDPRCPATEAFARDGEAIWLTEGWLPPAAAPEGAFDWWAGPERVSRLAFRRTRARAIVVEIAVVNGIGRDEIAAFGAEDHRPLPCLLDGAEGTCLTIPLDGLGAEGEVLFSVPRICSPIEVSPTDTETGLRSFAGRNWRLL